MQAYAVQYDVIDRMTRDVIEACATPEQADVEAATYAEMFPERMTCIRQTRRLMVGREHVDFVQLVRDGRQRRDEQHARRQNEIRERNQRAWAA